MMRLRRASVIAALLIATLVSLPVHAQESSTPEAHELARLVLSSGMFEIVIDTAGDTAMTVVAAAMEGRLRRSLSADERSKLRGVFIQAFKDTFPWQLWEDLYARVFSQHATPSDITDFLTFYQTPLGRRALSLSVILTKEGAKAGRSLVQSRQQEFNRTFTEQISKGMPALKAELDRSGGGDRNR